MDKSACSGGIDPKHPLFFERLPTRIILAIQHGPYCLDPLNTTYFSYVIDFRIMIIPNFDDNGNIPVGEYGPLLSEFKTRFVEEFDTSITRRDL